MSTVGIKSYAYCLNHAPETGSWYGGTPYEPPQIVSPMTIVRDGRSDFSIVVPQDADACVRTAAREMQTYIRRISGAELPWSDCKSYSSPQVRCAGSYKCHCQGCT